MDVGQLTSHFEKNRQILISYLSWMSLACFSRYLLHSLAPWSLPERRIYINIRWLRHPHTWGQAKGEKWQEIRGKGWGRSPNGVTSGQLLPLTKSLSFREVRVFSALSSLSPPLAPSVLGGKASSHCCFHCIVVNRPLIKLTVWYLVLTVSSIFY